MGTDGLVYISTAMHPNSYYRFVQEDRLAGSSLVVVEFHDHDHDHDQPDQFHFSWSDETRNRGEIVSSYNLQWVVRIPRADAAAVLGEANPSQSQSEAATRRCHIRTGPTLDFTHFKRHKRGNLQYDGTEWRGVSVHRSWRSCRRSAKMSAQVFSENVTRLCRDGIR